MLSLERAYAVRCPSKRKHGAYDHCGHILCLVLDGEIYIKCQNSSCKNFWKIELEGSDAMVSMIPVSKETRIKLENSVRNIK